MTAYYNEIEPYAAQWLRNLIARNLIAPGDVDERSIIEVRPDDLRGYDQCHFFAGIGGWSYALRLAGWPDDRPVWTGSCPCQPFSTAGKQRGSEDERHLWPAWFRLIRECRPATVFGEQVGGASGLAWLDHVLADLEGDSYTAAAAVVPACGVGAPHIRNRLWLVADATIDMADSEHAERRSQRLNGQDGCDRPDGGREEAHGEPGTRGQVRGMADHDTPGRSLERSGGLLDGERPARRDDADGCGADGRMADLQAVGRRQGREDASGRAEGIGAQGAGRGSADDGGRCVGDSDDARLERRRDDAGEHASQLAARQTSPWRDLEWLPCSDGKARPTQPGLFPLAHGVPGRVGRLRAYGNAIVPQVAAEVIAAYM